MKRIVKQPSPRILERRFQKLTCEKYSEVYFWTYTKDGCPIWCVHHITINDESEDNDKWIQSEINNIKQCPNLMRDCAEIRITYHHRMYIDIPRQSWAEPMNWQYREETIRV